MSYADTSTPPMPNAPVSPPAPTRWKTPLLFLGWATFGGSWGAAASRSGLTVDGDRDRCRIPACAS